VKSNSRLGRRRSQRVTLSVPVVVSEAVVSEKDKPRVIEKTHSVAVNRYGGLIALHASVDWGQSLVLTNPFSRVHQECRVVYLGPSQPSAGQHEKRLVGIEFTEPVSNFWNISFPAYGARGLGAISN